MQGRCEIKEHGARRGVSHCYREENDPAPAKRQKHSTSSVARHGSIVSRASNSVNVRQNFPTSFNSRQLRSSGVARGRQQSSVRASPRMLASTAASRSGSRKLRRPSQSSFSSSYGSPSSSRDVSMSSVMESSSNGIPRTLGRFDSHFLGRSGSAF